MKNECQNCKIEFESKRQAKYCSPRCKLQAFRKQSIETDNVTLSQPAETDKFKFSVTYNKKAGDIGYDEDTAKQRARVREATYWYDVPLNAIPELQKDWAPMPDFMNGRQYFLWWKNDFEVVDAKEEGATYRPVILNPFPVRDKVEYVNAREGSRRWGA